MLPLVPPPEDIFEDKVPMMDAASSLVPETPRVTKFQPVDYRDLAAIIDVAWPNGWTIRAIPYFVRGVRRWVTPPTRLVGKDREWLITFAMPEAQDRFQSAVLTAIENFLVGGNDHAA